MLETWLISSSGRLLGFVTNTERAMVTLLDGEGDPGAHAVDPGASGSSAGFTLSNGRADEYANRDTVSLDEAVSLLRHIVSTGSWPATAHWTSDR